MSTFEGCCKKHDEIYGNVGDFGAFSYKIGGDLGAFSYKIRGDLGAFSYRGDEIAREWLGDVSCQDARKVPS